MNGCSDPGCPYRSLYEGAQESLKSMTTRQAQNLDRVNRVRSGVISAMKSTHPRLFSSIEAEMPARMREVDDRLLMVAVEELMRRLNNPAPNMDALRKVLEDHGFALPGSDDPDQWADALVDQQPSPAHPAPPLTDPTLSAVAVEPTSSFFPTPPGAPRTLHVTAPTPPPVAVPTADPLPAADEGPDFPGAMPDVYDGSMEDITDSGADFEDLSGLDELFGDIDSAGEPFADDDDWLSDLAPDDPAPSDSPAAPSPEPPSTPAPTADPAPTETVVAVSEVDDFADLFGPDPDPEQFPVAESPEYSESSDFDELFADVPGSTDGEVAAVSNDFDDLFDTPAPDTAPVDPPKPEPVTPAAPQPQSFFPTAPSAPLRPMTVPAANPQPAQTTPARRKRSRSVTAVRPGTDTATPVVQPVSLTTRQSRELDALLSQPRPVFFSEIEQLLTKPTADAWYDNLKANRRGGDKTLAYVVGKARFSKDTGPLIMRDEGHESELQKNDESGWREIRHNYRAHHLYAAAHVFWRLRDQIITTEVESRVFAMIIRPANDAPYGLVVAVGDDFKSGSDMYSQIDAQVLRLSRSKLDHITVVTTGGTKAVYQSMVEAVEQMSKQWTFAMPVRVGYSHEVSSSGTQEEVYRSPSQ